MMNDEVRRVSASDEGTVRPVVLCGGSGTRLWPLSRQAFAKQHVPLIDGQSLLQQTLLRLVGGPFTAPLVVAGASSRFLVTDQADAIGIDIELALEPEGRDTLAAIVFATLLAARHDPQTPLLVTPSDHLVPDIDAFATAVGAGAELAGEGHLVVFGIRPHEPATGYGYIAPGEPIGTGRHVNSFVEKPDVAKARDLISAGCLWNSGMFCFRPDTLLQEVARLEPDVLALVEEALAGATTDLAATVGGTAFGQVSKISFDYAIMEKTARAVVLPVDFAWSDVGDWKEAWRLAAKDEAGVARIGPVFASEVANSYLRADTRLVCALGIENVAVIDTTDAVLVAPLDRAQEVKGFVAELAAAGRPEAHVPARVHRPWGWYQTVDLGERFRVKRIQVHPGRRLSLQKHHHRAEHWVVVRGTAEVTRDDEVMLVQENQSIYLPLGCVHRLANPGKIPVEIIEVQTGAYLEEDDIIRLEDDFQRS